MIHAALLVGLWLLVWGMVVLARWLWRCPPERFRRCPSCQGRGFVVGRVVKRCEACVRRKGACACPIASRR